MSGCQNFVRIVKSYGTRYIHACKWLQPDVTAHSEHNSKQHEKASKVIKQEYVAKENASCAAEPKKIAPKNITTKQTVAMKHIE
jgi:hypothetical protein